jgi:hypothetical protein
LADRLAMDALMPSVRNFWPKKSTIGCRSPFCGVSVRIQNSCSRVAKNSGIAIAASAGDKKT